jgi:hypothetical protein
VLQTGDSAYELHPEIGRMAAHNIQAKIEALRKNAKSHLDTCESLLESAREEYDGYDILMSKYLLERIAKMKFVTAVMARHSSLLRLLDSSGAGGDTITKIAID